MIRYQERIAGLILSLTVLAAGALSAQQSNSVRATSRVGVPVTPTIPLFFSDFNGSENVTFINDPSYYIPPGVSLATSSEGQIPGGWKAGRNAMGDHAGPDPWISTTGGIMRYRGGQGNFSDRLHVVHELSQIPDTWFMEVRFIASAGGAARPSQFHVLDAPDGDTPADFNFSVGLDGLHLNGTSAVFPALQAGRPHIARIWNLADRAVAEVYLAEETQSEQLLSSIEGSNTGSLAYVNLVGHNYTAEEFAIDSISVWRSAPLFYSNFNGSDNVTLLNDPAYYIPPGFSINVSSNGTIPGQWLAGRHGDHGGTDPWLLADNGILQYQGGQNNFSDHIHAVHALTGIPAEWYLEIRFVASAGGGGVRPVQFHIIDALVDPVAGNFSFWVGLDGIHLNDASATFPALAAGRPHLARIWNLGDRAVAKVYLTEEGLSEQLLSWIEAPNVGGLSYLNLWGHNFTAAAFTVDEITLANTPVELLSFTIE